VDSNSIVALSVSISQITWPTVMRSPGFTFHATMRPSSIVLPA
jgi:hypothetical protein